MPYSHLSVESVLSLALVILALGVASLSLVVAFAWRRGGVVDARRIEATVAGLFVVLTGLMLPMIMAFLGGLLLLFAPPSTPAPIRTFEATPEEAAALAAGLGVMVVGVLGVAVLAMLRTRDRLFDGPFALVVATYVGASAVFVLLLLMLLFAVGGAGVVGGTIEGAGLILAASCVSMGTALFTRGWMQAQLCSDAFDQEAWNKGTLRRGGFVVVVGMPLAILGAFLIAS